MHSAISSMPCACSAVFRSLLPFLPFPHCCYYTCYAYTPVVEANVIKWKGPLQDPSLIPPDVSCCCFIILACTELISLVVMMKCQPNWLKTSLNNISLSHWHAYIISPLSLELFLVILKIALVTLVYKNEFSNYRPI